MTPARRHIRTLAAALALAAGTSALAQTPAERIAAARQQQIITDQKTVAAVEADQAEAEKLAATDPKKAVEKLKTTLLGIDLAVGISTETRKRLTEQLQTRIALIENPRAVTPGTDPKAAAVKLDQRAALTAALTEAKEVQTALAKAAAAADKGDFAGVKEATADVRRKYPNNPAIFAMGRTDLNRVQIRAEKQLADEYASAWLGTMRATEASAIPMAGDIAFPKKQFWDKITEMRKQPAIQLTDREKKIIGSLEATVTANFKGRPFREALQDLSNQIGQPIHIEEKSLEDLGLDLARPVSFNGTVSGRTALRAVLQSLGLTFVVKDEMIQVMTLEKAQAQLVTRSYYLGDLITGTGPFGNAVLWGPTLSYQQAQQTAQQVVDGIVQGVDPLAWSTGRGNGPCSITFNLTTMSIVVRASAEVHASLGNSIGGK